MDEQVLRKIIKEVIGDALEPIKETQQQHTESLVSIENTNNIYGDMYKLNNDNMKKLERRVEKLEEDAGINPEPDDTLAALQ